MSYQYLGLTYHSGTSSRYPVVLIKHVTGFGTSSELIAAFKTYMRDMSLAVYPSGIRCCLAYDSRYCPVCGSLVSRVKEDKANRDTFASDTFSATLMGQLFVASPSLVESFWIKYHLTGVYTDHFMIGDFTVVPYMAFPYVHIENAEYLIGDSGYSVTVIPAVP
jgi:hypothetical protein